MLLDVFVYAINHYEQILFSSFFADEIRVDRLEQFWLKLQGFVDRRMFMYFAVVDNFDTSNTMNRPDDGFKSQFKILFSFNSLSCIPC